MADDSKRMEVATTLRKRLQEISSALREARQEAPSEEPAPEGGHRVSGPLERCVVTLRNQTEIVVTIGTSDDAQKDPTLVQRICNIVSSSYTAVGKSKRMDAYDAMDRLEMGDDGLRANRVLHLAYKDGVLVGCASSTFSPGWTPDGCGHWGLLAVDPAHQNCGAATALVLAAERRLATVSELIQIEFRNVAGDPFCDRLFDWYVRLGFNCGSKRTGFVHAYKQISEERQRWGQKQRLVAIHDFYEKQLAEIETQQRQHEGYHSGVTAAA
mmetsp:Transcript_40537/g.63424  ORF Transcript_40537/g.63424 Transcript_40537/m.63424 type:complete len:270 (+) Transcript_40537:63-872(+)|eukprot:CAMPEP_0169310676 /NCGR_PEP_ID=MMETSP1017-20121227/3097_1 /TAXON_ID=342587 /ORGANISM="Karlodinium micrum, Strain CCMP2283" /LENGTH=269 /DNA_ID=CAMNT_0009404335 /DNA_START=29 /DNA_END=838 /DNA_ORIENTATION=-